MTPPKPFANALALALSLALWCPPASADPGHYLVSVYSDPGKVHVDCRYWTVKRQGGAEVVWPEISQGYNVNARWYTELYMSYIGPSLSNAVRNTLNWQSDFLLTQGQWDVDVALHTNLIRGQQSVDDHAVEFGPAQWLAEAGP